MKTSSLPPELPWVRVLARGGGRRALSWDAGDTAHLRSSGLPPVRPSRSVGLGPLGSGLSAPGRAPGTGRAAAVAPTPHTPAAAGAPDLIAAPQPLESGRLAGRLERLPRAGPALG